MPIAPSTIIVFLLATATAYPDKRSVLLREVVLNASSASEESAYNQIQKIFGDGSVESPDLFKGDHSEAERIRVRDDPEVGPCFDFYLHRDEDGDRDVVWPRGQRRQRNEIKGYKGSDAGLKATRGQVVRYHWLFRINGEMSVTKQFCHFFQLKAVGGDNTESPIFTISGSIVDGRSQLELRTRSAQDGPRDEKRIFDWDSSRNKWIECVCVACFDEEGYFRISLRSLDGTLSFGHEVGKMNTWRKGSKFVRPKWGIYRSLEDKGRIVNKEDTVSFARFRIQEWSDLGMPTVRESDDTDQSASAVDQQAEDN